MRSLDDRELMRLHVETLFTHTPEGRMVRVNEPQGRIAPRFFLGRTAHGNEWRFRYDLPDALVQELEAVCSAEPAGGEFLFTPYGSVRYEELLARTAPIERMWAGPAYHFPGELPEPSNTVRVTEKNADLLRPHLAEWLGDIALRQPMLAFLIGGRAVSVCCSVRTTSGAHEAGVETASEFRGHGYATKAVAAWAGVVRGMNRIPLYSTSWENTASQSLARRLGLKQYGADLHIT